MQTDRTLGSESRQRAYRLRARLRRISPSTRERGCGVLCVEHHEGHPSIIVRRGDGAPKATWNGVLSCRHIWTCPVCSRQIVSERAARAALAVQHLGGRWVMLTATVRHRAGDRLRRTMHGLSRAWRRTRQGGYIQKLWSEKVTASIRSMEVKWGENGWHPHIHVLLRLADDFSEGERLALFLRFQSCIVKELGAEHRPNFDHGLHWSDPFDGADPECRDRVEYIAKKLGLEIAGMHKTSGDRLSPWELAERAGAGDQDAKALWWEYHEATRGRRMIEMDERAAAAADDAELEQQAEALARSDSQDVVERVEIEVEREDLRRLRTLERKGVPLPETLPGVRERATSRSIMALLLVAAEQGGRAAVDEWIAYARESVGDPVRDPRGPPSWWASRFVHESGHSPGA